MVLIQILDIEILLELGGELPKPSNIEAHTQTDFGKNYIVSFIEIDMNFDKKERVNVSLPRYILKYMVKEVDSNPQYKDRSDFIAQTALEKRYA